MRGHVTGGQQLGKTYKLERDLENDCVGDAAERGWLSVKLDKARKGWPDRAFFGHASMLLLVEFKLPGENPTPLQAGVHVKLAARDHPVAVIDNRHDFTRLLDNAEAVLTAIDSMHSTEGEL